MNEAVQARILKLIKEGKLTQTGGLILLHNISTMDDPDRFIDELEQNFK